MKLIKPSFEIIEDGYPINKKMDFGPLQLKDAILDNIYKHIELAGRTCYKSEDRITEDSAKAFADRMIKSGHGAMLEHGTVYLYLPWVSSGDIDTKYLRNKYSKSIFYSNVKFNKDGSTSFIPIEYGKAGYYITTNLRVLVENNWMDDLKYLCEPTEHHERRVTVRFICDRGVSHEFVRHRVFSFAQESTRYCNYSKDKFGNELTFIIPCWADSFALQSACNRSICISDEFGKLLNEHYYHLNGREESYFKPWEITPEQNFVTSLQISEQLYLELLNQNWKPQQARAILPNSLKTELVMTGFISDWKHFFDLRCPESAHPQARELAIPLREEFIKRNYIK